MNRREAIQKAALTLGYAISASAAFGVLNGCKARPDLVYKPDFFTEDQALTISELAEIILPKTTTPGAKDVGVPGFIDDLLKTTYSKELQEKFLKELAEFDEEAKKTYGDIFGLLKKEDQLAFVKKKHDEALDSDAAKKAPGFRSYARKKSDNPFVLTIKELTLLGFFTSEAGATQVLQYNQVPGPYHGCVPLEKVGKAWAV
ncbi:MAG TPA: gluconate 2-dehydrogenase subunit 3 family protein [Cyclobacteriaceae bacterium]|nr:gluconate 2-dehydrogenase subunit 3 family protein [Cyclobacteriaceae bacterium]